MIIKGVEIVEKRNILNELRHNNMTLQELRFFSIYLSRINARDMSTRRVTFKLEDFRKIMEIGRMNIQHFRDIVNSLLSKIISIPNEDGRPGYTAFQLFRSCKLYQDEIANQWYVEIDAHDKSLPLMFDLKRNYFRYELWNTLKLKSVNQFRMYEVLKQYENVGFREISLVNLKSLLGIKCKEYLRWDNFKVRVIDVCQKSLAKFTDIAFDYKPMKTGKKITGIKFIIRKNMSYCNKLSFSEFVSENLIDEISELYDKKEKKYIYKNAYIETLASACEYEFSEEEMRVILDMLLDIGFGRLDQELETYEYLLKKYHELNANDEIPRNETKRRYGYLKWLIKRKRN